MATGTHGGAIVAIPTPADVEEVLYIRMAAKLIAIDLAGNLKPLTNIYDCTPNHLINLDEIAEVDLVFCSDGYDEFYGAGQG